MKPTDNEIREAVEWFRKKKDVKCIGEDADYWLPFEKAYFQTLISLAQSHLDRPELEPLDLAISFHNIYERIAPEFGYETRKDTKEFKPDSPNGKLMIAVCKEIINNHFGQPRKMSASEIKEVLLTTNLSKNARKNLEKGDVIVISIDDINALAEALHKEIYGEAI